MEATQSLMIIGSILIPLLSGFAWIIHRMDNKFEKVDGELKLQGERMARIEGYLNGRGSDKTGY
jgi:hypothetical protein